MALKKVDVHDLKLGMYVADLDRPWMESPFLFQGFRIEQDTELKQLRETCKWVMIDPERGYDGPAMSDAPRPAPSPSTTSTVVRGASGAAELTPKEPDIRKAVGPIYQARQRAAGYLDQVLQGIREGKPVDTASAGAVVDGLTRSVQLNVNAAMWLNNLKKRHEDSANHCTNVAVVSLAFAHHLGYEGDQLVQIGVGALLHDVGLMRLPVELLNKPDKLTQEEEAELRKHPLVGQKIVESSGDISKTAMNIILHHHERLNGKGYPAGLSGSQIPREALVVALADVYDAMTSERPYKRSSSPHGTLNVLKQLSETDFGTDLVQQFMSCIGIYPISSVVQLNNGSIAMVVGHSRRTRLRPEVMVLKNAQGRMYKDWPLMDLDKRIAMKDGEQWQIMRVVSPKDFDVDVARVTEAYVDRLYQSHLDS
jgi:HD-GYP domain-containing protein (c-di-GMP phosphodiesterase class II)